MAVPWWKFLLALCGFGWRDIGDDGMFVRQRNLLSGEERHAVPAARIRKLSPWMKPEC
jgi:hypothetical protein